MATWYDTSALDALLNVIGGKDGNPGANSIRLLDQYTQGMTYAQVDTYSIADAAITTTDFTTPADVTVPDSHRKMDFLGKTGAATKDSTLKQLHIALVDTVNSTVLAVTNETSDQPITNGNQVTFPAFYMQSSQPTQI